jgi:transcription initiation factor IIE alpha subunit
VKFTSTGHNSVYQKVIRENKTLKAQVLACLRFGGHTSFELEERLNRLHQSVSSTLTRLQQEGVVEVNKFDVNDHGFLCGVYTLRRK